MLNLLSSSSKHEQNRMKKQKLFCFSFFAPQVSPSHWRDKIKAILTNIEFDFLIIFYDFDYFWLVFISWKIWVAMQASQQIHDSHISLKATALKYSKCFILTLESVNCSTCKTVMTRSAVLIQISFHWKISFCWVLSRLYLIVSLNSKLQSLHQSCSRLQHTNQGGTI